MEKIKNPADLSKIKGLGLSTYRDIYKLIQKEGNEKEPIVSVHFANKNITFVFDMDFLKARVFDEIGGPVPNWIAVKQKYLEHLINNYDHGYLALFEWLEKNYSGISTPAADDEVKYQQCPECFNSDKNCEWCNGEGIIPIN